MQIKFNKDILHSRKLKHGGLSLILTILFLVVVIVINMIFGVLGDKYPFFSVDLTKEQAFNMTQNSIDFVQGLDDDVTITVLADEDGFINWGGTYYYQYFMQANTIIKQYQQYNNRITVNYVNTSKNPSFLNNYTDQQADAGDIIVECGDRVKVVAVEDLFNMRSSMDQTTGQTSTTIVSSKAEQTMTSAILNVTSDEQVKVSLLTAGNGQEEQMATNFISMLETNNYEVTVQNVVSEEIDPEAKLVVIFAPTSDYSEEVVKKLEKFMSNDEKLGKSLLYFVNPQKGDTPNLDAFLKNWDIAVGDGMVAETNSNMRYINTVPYSGLSEYADQEFQAALKNPNLYTIIPYSRELQDLGGGRTDSVRVLLQGSESSAVSPKDTSNWYPTKDDIVGTVPTVLLSEDTTYINNSTEVGKGSVAVVGSYLAVDSTFTSSNSFNNSAYFINLVNVLSERDSEGVTIEDKAVGTSELTITAGPGNTIGITMMVIVPLAIMVVSLIIWIRRRNR